MAITYDEMLVTYRGIHGELEDGLGFMDIMDELMADEHGLETLFEGTSAAVEMHETYTQASCDMLACRDACMDGLLELGMSDFDVEELKSQDFDPYLLDEIAFTRTVGMLPPDEQARAVGELSRDKRRMEMPQAASRVGAAPRLRPAVPNFKVDGGCEHEHEVTYEPPVPAVEIEQGKEAGHNGLEF